MKIDYYTKEERKAYNRLRTKIRRVTPKGISITVPFAHPELYPQDLDGCDTNCETFGCNGILSLRETLFGKKCINCQQNGIKIDVTHIIFKK